jgi:hypothetical protein
MIFEKGSFTKERPCMICGGVDNNQPTILIPIDGTQEGNNEIAEMIHVRCLKLRMNEEEKIIYFKYK